MMNEDAAWFAEARPAMLATCDACFRIEDAFRAGPTSVPLQPPGLQSRSPGWFGTTEVLGREGELIAYYERLLAIAGTGDHAVSLRRPFPYFTVRPAIFAEESLVTWFAWTDDVPETQAMLDALADPKPQGVILDDLDQCWAIRIARIGDRTAFIEWDAEGPPPDEGGWIVQTSQIAAQATAALARLDIVHGRLVAALGHDYWTYRPPPPDTPSPGRLTRLFRAVTRSRGA